MLSGIHPALLRKKEAKRLATCKQNVLSKMIA